MIVLGIDPGLDGAMAVLGPDGGEVFYDTPTLTVEGKSTKRREYDIRVMADNLRHTELLGEGRMAFIENVHAMPGQGVRSMFSMGFGLGIWHALLVAFRVPYVTVTPQRWKKALMDGMGKEKAASVVVASRLFPEAPLYTKRGRGLEGRADALLIAEYGRRLHGTAAAATEGSARHG